MCRTVNRVASGYPHKQVATFRLIGHLRQIVSVDVDEAMRVVRESLKYKRVALSHRRVLMFHRPLIHIMAFHPAR